MRDFDTLSRALQYIEENLGEALRPEDIARHSFTSVSSLQKLFRYAFDYSLKEYITKRRLALAARALTGTGDTILSIALRCGYHSPENFTRAFRAFWGTTPSEYRRRGRFTEGFPPIRLAEGGAYKDSAQLYDLLRQNRDCPVICFDVAGLMEVNRRSRRQGDLVIAEAVRRIDSLRQDQMPLFRIGGDEFALLALGAGEDFCREVLRSVEALNPQPLRDGDEALPVVLRTWVGKNTGWSSPAESARDLIRNVKYGGG